MPTPRQILDFLLPTLKTAARYAQQIQPRIGAQPNKSYDNPFGAALSDADLSIQTIVEVALLGTFPDLRFYGEEFEQSYNTKYFRAITLGDRQAPDDYLVTLDPIDGTRFYLDGHANYGVILTIMNADDYQAAIALFPSLNRYFVACQGETARVGTFADDLAAAQPLDLTALTLPPVVYSGRNALQVGPKLQALYPDRYQVLSLGADYRADRQIPNHTNLLMGDFCGSILNSSKWIDGAAIAFIAQCAGAIVTRWDGSPPLPLYTNANYDRAGLVIAMSPIIHQDLLAVTRSLMPLDDNSVTESRET